MRFATVDHHGDIRAAVVVGEVLHLFDAGTTVLDLVRSGLPAALASGAEVVNTAPPVPASETIFQAPFRPPTIRDFVVFEEHVEGVRRSVQDASGVPDAWYAAPHFYFANPHTVTGPDTAIAAPAGSRALDFELEVAAVVGSAGHDLTVDRARHHIFGYTILNDWSARDLQKLEMQVGLGPAKGKDFADTLGPVVVTADELDGYLDADGFLTLSCSVSVNGVEVGSDVLSNMGWTFPAMVAYASRDSAVEPGDVLGSGTVGHGGCLAEWWGRRGEQDPPPLQPGDTVTLTVQGIGVLTNSVGAQSLPTPALPAPRRLDHEAERARYSMPVRPL